MKILKIAIMVEDGALLECDMVRYKGKLWLVPDWIENLANRTQSPIRIVCLDSLPVQRPDRQGAHPKLYCLQCPMRTAVLDGREKVAGVDVVEAPSIVLKLPSALH
jgi:hypothetical protein